MLLYYPKAGLDPDFQRATRSLRNLAKAAACLIDLELANAQLPTWAKEVFFRDPEFGLPIPGAAYNGGASQSLLVARLIETYAKKQGIDKERYLFHLFPWDHFLAWVDESRAKLKPETRGYIEKIIAVTRHLSRHRPRLPVVNFEGDLG